jgi:hypothetical protein
MYKLVQACASQKRVGKVKILTSSCCKLHLQSPIPNTRYLYHSECIYMLSKRGLRVWDIVCLLLLAVIADDNGDENSTFVIRLITINFSEVSGLLQTCLIIDIKWCVVNRLSPAFTVWKFRQSSGLVGLRGNRKSAFKPEKATRNL